jgi:iron complex outermembrane receptor protein
MAVLGAAAVGTSLPIATANAADEPVVLQEVVVTGSILRRADIETPSPVTVMSAESLEERGINTVSEAMQRMSANNAGTITSNWNVGFNFATGANAPALRGLTVQATLSIADGLRLAPYPLADDGQRNFVDLNTIPSAIVERIEVLRDGASSTYGADAIAGVVNVITKKEIQGLHVGGSAGMSEKGGGDEKNFDLAWGHGDLNSDGYNFYFATEYQKSDKLKSSQRDYPFNTFDWQRQCAPSGSCMANLNWNGITAEDGSFYGFFAIPGVSVVRPVLTDTATTGSGRYAFLNPAAGCREWPSVTIDPSMSTVSPLTTCEVDYKNAYYWLQPEIEKIGLSFRFTGNIGDNAQMYAMMNYYKTDTYAEFTPYPFRNRPPVPRGSAQIYEVLLPVYVCPQGVGTLSGLNTGCDASNGTLNPYNPYAAQGLRAQIALDQYQPRAVDTSSRALRVALGVDGSFSGDWRYSANFTASEVGLTRTSINNMIPQRIMDVVARGTYNFSDPYATPADVWDYMAPDKKVYSPSRLWQAQATISKDLMDLSGGPLQAALGASYREESINAPSANPQNDTAPYQRYYSINAVGTQGSRDVTSGFFEIDAPVLTMLDLQASGRFDDYSSGQSNFSPKLGFKLTPIDMLTVRGTWSKGFRIPSFNEAYGLPTTGYVSRTVSCTTYPEFCASHGNNAGYYTNYSLGLTQTGDPGLKPEKSTSMTLGLIFQPMDNLSLTVDFWQIEVKDLISGVTSTAAAEAAYYSNNGVVDIPGYVVTPGTPDTAFPNALPVIGTIASSYQNQDKQKVSGVDFGANFRMPLGGSVTWISTFDASYLEKYELITDGGETLRYDGTLSPCNITSCSGAPKWRASWQNTFQIGDTSASLTAYYTSGLDLAAIDFGGIKGDCQYNADEGTTGANIAAIDGTPVLCKSKAVWNADLTVRHQLNDQVTLYADVLNVFGIKAEFDPAAAYGLYGFNPSWSGANIMGRYFRLGFKLDFE